MKVKNFFEPWMNKSEIKLLFILLIWELWTANYSPKVFTLMSSVSIVLKLNFIFLIK